jgi:hypothetical protein
MQVVVSSLGTIFHGVADPHWSQYGSGSVTGNSLCHYIGSKSLHFFSPIYHILILFDLSDQLKQIRLVLKHANCGLYF